MPFVERWIPRRSRQPDAGPARRRHWRRPHPQNSEQWAAVDLSAVGAAIYPRAGANPVDSVARADYFDSMYYSAAVVGVNTSALIESGIVGRPVYTIMTDEFESTQEGTLHFRHLKTVNGGLLHVARDLDEHLAQIGDALTGHLEFEQRSRQFVEAFVRPGGLDQPAAENFADAVEHLARMENIQPVPLSLAQRALRPLLYPLAIAARVWASNGQHANLIIVVAKTDTAEGAKGVSLMVVEVDNAAGFRRGRKLRKLGLDSADTSELFFEDVQLPPENLLGAEEGQGFAQLMNDLPRERLIVAVHAQAMIERALELTLDYVKQRQAFGKKIIEFQNTQFVLAECKSEATIGRVFHDHCIERYLAGALDTVTASMAKYWLTDLQGKVIDRCLQLFGGYGYMEEFPISRMYRDARVMRIYAGTNEIMKVVIARSL